VFDVGFPELVLVFIIGLLVLGPERLPKVAAEIGKWVGRARRTATELRRQLEREIELNDIQPPPPPAAQTPAQPDPNASADAASAPEADAAAPPSASDETSPSAEPPPSAPAPEPAADEHAVAKPDGTTTDEATERSPRA
jgi:sec-independent protein translocase protein TatB